MAVYKGVRSDFDITKPLKLYDADLVYSDLMNIFNTLPYTDGRRANQRVRMPTFGSYLKLYLFEANDNILRKNVKDEVARILALDPRVSVRSINVIINNNNVTVQVDATLKDIGIDKLMSFNFIRG